MLVFSCDRSRVREDGGTITIRVFVDNVNGLEFKKNQTQLINIVTSMPKRKKTLPVPNRGMDLKRK